MDTEDSSAAKAEDAKFDFSQGDIIDSAVDAETGQPGEADTGQPRSQDSGQLEAR
jgi:hypothetical protein